MQTTLPFHRRITDLFFSKLARASAWLFVGGIAGGILGYVFQVLMGRMLSTKEYGLFGAIMALYMVLSAPLGTLMMVISRKVSEYRAKQDVGSIAHFYYSMNIRTALVGGVFLGIYLLISPQIQSYLKASSAAPVYLLGVLLLVTFPPVINNAFLQGFQRFAWFSASNLLNVLLKIACSVLLISLGHGLAGAVGGSILAALFMWLITYAAIYRSLVIGRNKSYQKVHLSFKSALPVLIANAAFAAMTQLDMVLVNYYFSSHEAGLYAAASILGKAVMYLPSGIALALFPMVAENHARNEGSSHLLLQAVGLTFVLCGVGAIFYYLFGERIIVLLYGESYRSAGGLLRFFGFAIFPMALVMVAEYFLIAKGRVLFAYLFVVTAPIELLTIHFYHGSLQMVIVIIGASGLLLMILGYTLLWQAFRKR